MGKQKQEQPTLGERTKKIFSDHLFWVTLGIFIFGASLAAGFISFLKPWLVDSEVRSLTIEIQKLKNEKEQNRTVTSNNLKDDPQSNTNLPPVKNNSNKDTLENSFNLTSLGNNLRKGKLPLSIAVIGPVTGEHKDLGLSQLRGAIAGVMHFAKERCGLGSREYSQIATFTFFDTAPWLLDSSLSAESKDTLPNSDIQIGPVFSELAIRVVVNQRLPLLRPQTAFLLSTAASPKIRNALGYGKNVYQLSANIDSYVGQQTRFLAEYNKPRIRELVVIYRDDEYGRSARESFVIAGAQYGINVKSVSFALPTKHLNEQNATSQARELVRDFFDSTYQTKSDPTEVAVAVVAIGDRLVNLIQETRDLLPNALLLTPTSVDQETIESGNIDGTLVAYSYAPANYSVNTLAFHKQVRLASMEVDAMLGRTLEDYLPQTIDAEVHDALVFYLDTLRKNREDLFERTSGVTCDRDDSHPFATEMVISGEGKTLGHVGSLYLFFVRNGKLEPLEV